MFLPRWLRRPTPRQARSQQRIRPSVCQLEDRITPSGLFPSGPATHFAVLASSVFQAGRPAAVTVQAEDAHNFPAFGYMGTVHFELGKTDSGASLPADYTFSVRDHGRHAFLVTLVAPGSQTVTVSDTTTSSITGNVALTVAPGPVATRFVVQMPASVSAGLPVSVTVVAEDALGRRAWNYTGTVALTSSDGQAVLPGQYQFTNQDLGRHTFQVTFKTTGSQSLTVKDTASSSITGKTTAIVHPAPAATHFVLAGLTGGVAGTAVNVTVYAVDAAGNLAGNYFGTLHFTSTDPKAVLPANISFLPTQNGGMTFSVIFKTPGTQTLTVTATTGSLITGHKSFTVLAAASVTHFEIRGQDTASAGFPAGFFVVARDSSNNIVPTYTGTVHFTSTDLGATLPADYTFSASDHGRHLFMVTFAGTGTQKLTVTDKASSLTVTFNVLVS
jgi:hypothetical protein